MTHEDTALIRLARQARGEIIGASIPPDLLARLKASGLVAEDPTTRVCRLTAAGELRVKALTAPVTGGYRPTLQA